MKNIKIIETLAVCLFSIVLFSFAAVQENNLKAPAANTSQQIGSYTPAVLNLKQPAATFSSHLSFIAFSKAAIPAITTGIAILLIVLVIGFVCYNLYHIRP